MMNVNNIPIPTLPLNAINTISTDDGGGGGDIMTSNNVGIDIKHSDDINGEGDHGETDSDDSDDDLWNNVEQRESIINQHQTAGYIQQSTVQ